MRFVFPRPGRLMRAGLSAALLTITVPSAHVLMAQAGTPVLLLLGNHNAVAFAPTTLGNVSAAQTITLTNGGTADLVVSSITIGGVNAGDFTLVSSTCAVVAPGGFCTATVSFAPAANGQRSARLIVGNTAAGAPHMIPVMGRGIDPSLPQRAVGPIDPRHGFPLTYTDEAGTTVELCLDHTPSPTDGVTPLCLEPTPDPTQPPSLTDTTVNFPEEAFWWTAEAEIDTGNVTALLVLAQEAAFANELPAVGDQIAFGRVRFRLRGNGVVTGAWYRFTHPYGVDEFQAEDDIFTTNDVGCLSSGCDFSAPLASRITRFLKCAAPAAPAGYLGDPNVECTVTGSPRNTNLFRVARISGPGGNVVETIGQTTLFAVSGKISTAAAPPPPPPPTNTAPTAGDDAAITAENTAVIIPVLANDADADGDPLVVQAITAAPTRGVAAIGANGTSITYTPNVNVSGSDAFVYSITDGRGGVTSATVTVTISPRPNSVLTAVADAATTNTGTAVTIAVLANDTDADGDPLALVGTTAAASGTVVVNAATTVTYTPNAGFSGTDSFNYTIGDGRGGVASATVTVTVNATTPAPTGLVLALGFNETTGTAAVDASPSRNNGTITGAARVAGRTGAGGALSFDGVNDWVTVADAASLDLTNAMTLEAWVNPRALGGWRTIMMKERTGGLAYSMYADDGTFGAHPAGTMFFGGADDESVRGTSALPLNAWAHVSITYDGTMMRLYVNGTQVASEVQAGNVTTTTRPFRIGGNSTWGEFFSGTIDDVRVYNRVLSATEIQADMNTPIQ